MTHRIGTAIDHVKLLPGYTTIDRASADPKIEQLPATNDPVLPPCQLGNHRIHPTSPPFFIYRMNKGGFAKHGGDAERRERAGGALKVKSVLRGCAQRAKKRPQLAVSASGLIP
jgi:hypothetical protein